MTKILLNTFLLLGAVLPVYEQDMALAEDQSGKVTVLCFATFQKQSGDKEILFDNPLATFLESTLQEKGWTVSAAPTVPLVSRELLQYTLVESGGIVGGDVKTGRLYIEIGSGGTAKIESEQGISAHSTLEIRSVHWMLDREKALALAKNLGSKSLLLVTAEAEDITASLSPAPQLSGQRSVRAVLAMNMVEVATGKIINSFSEEMPVMDSHGPRAAAKGWKVLADSAIKQWTGE